MTDKAFLSSLKEGDKVAIRQWVPGAGWDYSISEIIKITPKRHIQVRGILQKFRDGCTPSDQYNSGLELCPLTYEIEEKVLRRDTIALMRYVKEDLISTEKLRKIKAILEDKEVKE